MFKKLFLVHVVFLSAILQGAEGEGSKKPKKSGLSGLLGKCKSALSVKPREEAGQALLAEDALGNPDTPDQLASSKPLEPTYQARKESFPHTFLMETRLKDLIAFGTPFVYKNINGQPIFIFQSTDKEIVEHKVINKDSFKKELADRFKQLPIKTGYVLAVENILKQF